VSSSNKYTWRSSHDVPYSLIKSNLGIWKLCVHEATKRFTSEQEIYCSSGSCRNYFLGCLSILELTASHCTHAEVFLGFLWVWCMLLPLLITLCAMQYLISPDHEEWADQRHCSEVALLNAGHIVKRKPAQTGVMGAVNHFCFAHLFHGDKSHQTPRAPRATGTNPCPVVPAGQQYDHLEWVKWVNA